MGRRSLIEENHKHLIKIDSKRKVKEDKLSNIKKERRGSEFFNLHDLNEDEKESKLVNIIDNKIKNLYK